VVPFGRRKSRPPCGQDTSATAPHWDWSSNNGSRSRPGDIDQDGRRLCCLSVTDTVWGQETSKGRNFVTVIVVFLFLLRLVVAVLFLIVVAANDRYVRPFGGHHMCKAGSHLVLCGVALRLDIVGALSLYAMNKGESIATLDLALGLGLVLCVPCGLAVVVVVVVGVESQVNKMATCPEKSQLLLLLSVQPMLLLGVGSRSGNGYMWRWSSAWGLKEMCMPFLYMYMLLELLPGFL
jgi:hypothetical protein